MVEDIEKRIREHYCAANGEWLVEKGKVKEGRLLKEACEVIESLRRENRVLWNNDIRKLTELRNREESISNREKELETRQARLMERAQSLKGFVEMWESSK